VNRKNIALISGAQSGAVDVLLGLATRFIFHVWSRGAFIFLCERWIHGRSQHVNRKNIALITATQSGAVEVLGGLATRFVLHAWFRRRFYFLL
jgi:uncharacterized membrane protein